MTLKLKSDVEYENIVKSTIFNIIMEKDLHGNEISIYKSATLHPIVNTTAK